jgi:hypothetical protein
MDIQLEEIIERLYKPMTNQLLRLSNPFSKRKDFWEELTEEQKQE